MNSLIVDMHIHTKFSDGNDSVEQIFENARKTGIKFLCITDHDTILGCKQAIAMGGKHFIKTMPGIEISSFSSNTQPFPVHILGYGVDFEDEQKVGVFDKSISINYKYYTDMAKKMLKQYIELGLLDEKTTLKIVRKKINQVSPVVHRMHLMHYRSIHAGISFAQAHKECFDHKILDYPDGSMISKINAVDLVHKLGGQPVLAHPGEILAYVKDEKELIKLIKSLVDAGLYGIEVYTTKHTSSQVVYFKDIARQYGLRVTAGSDYHGYNGNSLGIYGLTEKEFDDFMEGF